MNAEETAVAAVLSAYESALNHSDTEAVMPLYAPDGVFMPQFSPTSVGAAAVRRAYDAVFQSIALQVKFDVAEIRQVGPEWAIARTNSAGLVKFHSTGQSSPEANQELFVFQKINGSWKIARYSFSSVNPPRSA